jgi:hypothetical protein
MIRAIPFPNASLVTADVAGLAGCQGAEAERREKAFFDRVDDTACLASFQNRDGKATHRKDLIGSERRIGGPRSMVHVDDVVETMSARSPMAPGFHWSSGRSPSF